MSPLQRATTGTAALLWLCVIGAWLRGSTTPFLAAPVPFLLQGTAPASQLPPAPPRARVRPGPDAPHQPPPGAHRMLESGLQVWDVAPGEGQPARDGQLVVIDATVWTVDGTRVQTSHTEPDPQRFLLGGGRTPAGLDQGVRGQRIGGVRQLILPPELAYGDAGVPQRIPPNTTLIYEVTLLDVLWVPDAPTTGDRVPLADGVEIRDVLVGEGTPVVPGSAVVMDYVLWHEAEALDTSLTRTRAVEAVAGQGKLLAGWDLGILGMRAGGHRAIFVPGALAFGEEGIEGVVPPNTPILLDVWMRRVE